MTPVEYLCDSANRLRAAVHDVYVDACENEAAVYAVRFDCCDVARVSFRLAGTSALVVPVGSGCIVCWTAAGEAESEAAYLVACSAVEEGCEIYPVSEED